MGGVLVNILISGSAIAEEPIRLDPVVVEGLGEPASDAPTEARVLDAVQIERRSSLDLGEALRGQPGVQISRQGGVGEDLQLNIRGGSVSHTLVLVDGVPINNWAFSGVGRIAGFDPPSFERAEIVRGPFFPLSGPAAIGGVLRLRTVRAEDRTGYLVRADGAYPLGARALGLGTSRGEHAGEGIAAYGSVTPSGTSANEIDGSVVRPADSLLRWSGAGSYVQRVAGGELAATLRAAQFTRSLGIGVVEGDTFGLYLDGDRKLDSSLLLASLRWTSPGDARHAWSVRAGMSRIADFDRSAFGRNEGSRFGDAQGPLIQTVARLQQTSTLGIVGTDHAFEMGWPGTLLFGAEVQVVQASWRGPYEVFADQESLGSIDFAEQETRTTLGFYLADRIEFGMFDLLGGVRLDHDDIFGQAVSPRATLGSTLPGAGTRLTLSYGLGFRPPTFNELAVGNFANPDLKAEHARSAEVGVQQPLGKLGKVSAAAYRTWMRDMVSPGVDVVDGQEVFRWKNVASANLKGVELAADLTPGIARAGGSVTYVDARDGEGDRLPDISEWVTSVYAGVTAGRFETDAFFYSWSGRAASTAVFPVLGATPIGRTPAGNRVDVAGSWWFSDEEPSARVMARVEDLLDRRDEEFPGFPPPGRTFIVGLEVGTR